MAARLFRCLLGKDGVLQSARWAADRNTLFGQAFNMDGQSSIFLQLEADIVPAPHHKFGAPTMSFHAIDAGPVAGDYMNVGVEEGLGNWLEFGYTRSNHTDGGDPAIRSLFNFVGMDIFNVKRRSFQQVHTNSNTSLRFQSEVCSEQMTPLLSNLLNTRTRQTGTSGD